MHVYRKYKICIFLFWPLSIHCLFFDTFVHNDKHHSSFEKSIDECVLFCWYYFRIMSGWSSPLHVESLLNILSFGTLAQVYTCAYKLYGEWIKRHDYFIFETLKWLLKS